VLAVGDSPEEVIRRFGEATGEPVPSWSTIALRAGETLFWAPRERTAPLPFRGDGPRAEHRRHHRKYAQGDLGPDRSFYFRGADKRLNLQAHNLVTFLQLANGVDDETWLHHLRNGDYSRWFNASIKDDALTAEAATVENIPDVTAAESRARIRAAIERRYTLPS
jgi:hypothetical protein